MIVIGTAGHIDHGKSAIVKRLTGTDPDRLPEEKSRGMTIDLGFAFYSASGGGSIALVDVPGHERFVRNMIAGAGGIDAVMLVIAADDGWMPQSEEHFQITRLLGVRHGLIVINKTDLVEPDWLELLEQDVRDRVQGSFLQDAPIFKVSAQTGDGFEALSAHLDLLGTQLEARRDFGKARLYVDRSFIRQGIGGVVTGTLRGGSFKVGQTVSVWPSCKKGKIRTLQSNGVDVGQATPGQRTAVSLTSVDREFLIRGGVISDRLDLDYFNRHPVLAVSTEMLHNAPFPLMDRRRALFIVGTTEVEGEIRLMGQKAIGPSESGIAFFKPDNPVYALVGDRFILRLPTPMVSLGGGSVLDHLAHFPRRKQMDQFSYLEERVGNDLKPLAISELRKRLIVPETELLRDADFGSAEIRATVEELTGNSTVGCLQSHLFLIQQLTETVDALQVAMEEHLQENPHLKGLPVETLAKFVAMGRPVMTLVLEYMIEKGILARTADLYNLAGRGMSLKGVIKQAHDEIMAELEAHPYDPPLLASLAAKGKIHQNAIKYTIDSGECYKCGSNFLFLSSVWKEIVDFVRERLDADGEMAVADLKDRFGFTRKYTIPILEETDRKGLTERQGDFRVKGDKYEG